MYFAQSPQQTRRFQQDFLWRPFLRVVTAPTKGNEVPVLVVCFVPVDVVHVELRGRPAQEATALFPRKHAALGRPKCARILRRRAAIDIRGIVRPLHIGRVARATAKGAVPARRRRPLRRRQINHGPAARAAARLRKPLRSRVAASAILRPVRLGFPASRADPRLRERLRRPETSPAAKIAAELGRASVEHRPTVRARDRALGRLLAPELVMAGPRAEQVLAPVLARKERLTVLARK